MPTQNAPSRRASGKAASPGRKPARGKSPARAKPRSAKPDAIALLRDDHKRVSAMFETFDKMKSDGPRKQALVVKICSELSVHVQVEEEIFYPAARDAIRDPDLMDEADVEHASAKALIGELSSMKPGDNHYDAKVTVLGEYIKHHVKEEHEEMFPKVRRTRLDLVALGEAMAKRKRELAAHARSDAVVESVRRFIPMV